MNGELCFVVSSFWSREEKRREEGKGKDFLSKGFSEGINDRLEAFSLQKNVKNLCPFYFKRARLLFSHSTF